MKKISILLFFILSILATNAQIVQPVKWSFSINNAGENKFEIIADASIDAGWHLYSINLPEDGPVPTSLVIEESTDYKLVGGIIETPTPIVGYDETFEIELGYFKNNAKLTQLLEITGDVSSIKGYVKFMACDESQCLPPQDVEFELDIPQTIIKQAGAASRIWSVFWLSFLGGLASLLLPCVYPMIPITVSFFIRNADNKVKAIRDGFFYGLTIIFSYVVLGLAISVIFGPQALSSLAASPAFNIFFFLLLLVFAASFFGAFELTLPSKWSNSLDSKVDKTSGLVSVIFMGLTFVIVSFSCTGPVVGTLLVEAATEGNLLSPAIGMLGFSLALAIPFSLFAIFPTAMKSLPKSGGWMNSVKVVLGFIVVAFSLKYLSSADAAAGWRILDREVFLAIWIALFSLLGLYLLGKIKFAHDSDLKHIGIFRLFLIICTFSFVLYLIPGLWGAPLKAVSTFLPPITTQDFDMSRGVAVTNSPTEISFSENEKIKEGPYGLIKYIDYEHGLEVAKAENKPILLYFTGIVCTNCKKMETSVWSDPKVTELLKQFIIIALYTDDRKTLPDNEQYISKQTDKKVKTVGAKWMDLQIERYQNNTQPFYVILDHEENNLTAPMAYEPNSQIYIEWLESGINKFSDGFSENNLIINEIFVEEI